MRAWTLHKCGKSYRIYPNVQERLEAITGGKKLSFTAHVRRRLAATGKLLTPKERNQRCRLVRPETIVARFRQLGARKYDSSDARRGRLPKQKDIRWLATEAFEAFLWERGVKCVKIPAQSPNCNPHAERFVESTKHECLNHLVLFGEQPPGVVAR